jgi:predicted Zn finger-like uncharacterized protein
MDVRCEKCGTEYEFDSERVTEEGVTVKCSTCGHLFKIRKKSFVLTEPVMLGKKEDGESGERNWMVRRNDGNILSFKELTTLQKWIVERKVSREDEISKSGETWKRLGSIAELASFFQVVDEAKSATDTFEAVSVTDGLQAKSGATTQPLPAAAPASGLPTPIEVPTSPPPTAAPTEMGTSEAALGGQPVPGAPAPGTPSQVPQPQAAAVPPVEQPVQQAPAPSDQVAGQQEPSQGGPVLKIGSGAADGGTEPDAWGDSGFGESDDVVEKWKKRGRRKWFVIVPLLLICAGLGTWYLVSKETFMKVFYQLTGQAQEISKLAKSQFASGYSHFMKDSQDELAAAVKDLGSAILETKGKYPEAMATLAEVHVTRADKANRQIKKLDGEIIALEKQIADLKPKDGKEPDEKIKAAITPLHNKKVDLQRARMKVVDGARKDLEEAKRQIDGAQALDQKALAPKRALANYLRVMSSDRSHVEAPLAQAAAIAKDDPELLFIDGASLALDEASHEAAVEKLSRAIDLQLKAQKPDLIRARYKLAEILVALKRPEQAKQQLERILTSSPDHLEAKALVASLAPKPKPPPEEEKKPAEPGMPTSYEGWMTLANGLQQKGRTKKAIEAYDAALALKAEDAAALTGKGLCFLDSGSNSAAINWFKRALKSNSRYADAIMGLAESYKYQGDKKQAVVYYQRYVDVFPHGPEASVAKRNLKELK